MTNSLRFLVSKETLDKGGESKPAFNGQLVMKVWWANGRETQTVCANYGKAYDVIGGEAHPFDKWEIWGVVEALKPGDYLTVVAGCRALGINKHAKAVIREIKELGAEFSHFVSVQIQLVHGGKVCTLTARHINRLSDPEFNLAGNMPERKIRVRRR